MTKKKMRAAKAKKAIPKKSAKEVKGFQTKLDRFVR